MAAVSSEKEVFEDTGEGEEEIAREDEDNLSTGKRAKHSKKHKHKHSKKHKHKHKKRKHKKRSHSRSRSKSSSRSRSKSPESEDLPFYTKSDFENLSESGKNDTSEQDFEDKPKILSEESQDSILEDIVLANCEDSFSFKLTKSPSRSGSPLSVPANQLNTKEPEVEKPTSKSPESLCIENKVNLGFPLKIGIIPKSKSKSPDILEKKMNKRSRSRTPISDSEINKRSRSGSKSRSKSPDVSDPKINKKLGSRLPDPKIKKRSRSRSRSRTQVKSKNSRSKSPRKSDSKKKSRSSLSSKSSSSSKSRSRSHSKYRSISKSKSRSRSPRRKKRKGKSRSRSSSYSRRESRRKGRSHSRSVESRSPRKRRRTSYSNRTKRRSRSRSSTYRDRRSGYDASSRRSYRDNSTDRRRHYDSRSRRTRSRSPKRRYSRRSRSVSLVRSHRHKSRSRSPRRGRSKSPRGARYRRRSRSRSVRSRRRSRSRSYSSRRRRSRSRSKSRDRHQKRSRSKSTDKSTDGGKGVAMAVIPTTNADKPTAQDLVGKAPTVSDPSNKRSLEQLTEFCKKLAEARGIEGEEKTAESKEEEGEEEDASVEISHPFLVAPKRDITIPQVIFPVKPLPPIISSDKPLTEQFPVSCGTKHHEKEQENTVNETVPDVDGSASQVQQVFQQPQSQQKLDISSLVVKRMDAQRRLQADPNDVDAMLSLQEVEMKLNNWCQSNVKPGQFTGQLAKSMMPKEKFNSGYQAWARKDMFHNLNPVSGGVGMKLLQKMGWEPGQVLGKRGEGMVEPIALTVKVDRRGLSSNTEKSVGKKGGSKPAVDLQGKHPISSLQEYCARRKWQVPDFTLIFDEGPPHSKQFLFKVVVNGYEYQHPVVSSNKKHAKAQAAVAALKGLGLVPEDAEY